MIPPYYYFLPGVLILGIISSYTDFKSQQIKNRHLLGGIIYGCVIYLYLFFTDHFPISYQKFFINLIVAIAIGLSLYIARMWAPGDAKLFMVFSLLCPTQKYSSLFILPTLTLFINIALVSTAGIMLIGIEDLYRDPIIWIKRLFSKESLLTLLKSFIIIFSLTWALWFVFSRMHFLKQPFYFLLLYPCYFLIYKGINKLKSHKLLLTFIIAAGLIGRYILQPQFFSSLDRLLNYSIRMLRYTLVFQILRVTFLKERSKLSSRKEDKFAFAPFMFIGALTVNSPLILWVMKFLALLKK